MTRGFGDKTYIDRKPYSQLECSVIHIAKYTGRDANIDVPPFATRSLLEEKDSLFIQL